MLCFAINDRVSFEALEGWISDLQGIKETAPIMLIATKTDLRKTATPQNKLHLVSEQEIEAKKF